MEKSLKEKVFSTPPHWFITYQKKKMLGVPLSSHPCLRGPIMLLKNKAPTTLSLISLTLLVHVNKVWMGVRHQAFLQKKKLHHCPSMVFKIPIIYFPLEAPHKAR
jgi:hypothetical protein